MFATLTDLKGTPIHIRVDRVERVRQPRLNEYEGLCGAVLMFIGGSMQAVQELPGEAMRKMGVVSIKTGGKRERTIKSGLNSLMLKSLKLHKIARKNVAMRLLIKLM